MSCRAHRPSSKRVLCCALPGDYWGWWKPARSYHHTGPVSTFYALREALAIVGEEGLQGMWDRHNMVRRFYALGSV